MPGPELWGCTTAHLQASTCVSVSPETLRSWIRLSPTVWSSIRICSYSGADTRQGTGLARKGCGSSGGACRGVSWGRRASSCLRGGMQRHVEACRGMPWAADARTHARMQAGPRFARWVQGGLSGPSWTHLGPLLGPLMYIHSCRVMVMFKYTVYVISYYIIVYYTLLDSSWAPLLVVGGLDAALEAAAAPAARALGRACGSGAN